MFENALTEETRRLLRKIGPVMSEESFYLAGGTGHGEWEEVPAMDSKVQWTYPLTWDEPRIGQIHFHCLVTDAGETDALAFNDWIPADATSHLLLERALERRRRPAGSSPMP